MGCAPSKLPPEGHQLLAHDTHVTIKEPVWVRLTFRHLRTPHKRANYLFLRTKGSLAISNQRILGYIRNKRGRMERQVNVALDDTATSTRSIQFAVNEKGQFVVHADLAVTQPGGRYAGTMELVYCLPESASTTVLSLLPPVLLRSPR